MENKSSKLKRLLAAFLLSVSVVSSAALLKPVTARAETEVNQSNSTKSIEKKSKDNKPKHATGCILDSNVDCSFMINLDDESGNNPCARKQAVLYEEMDLSGMFPTPGNQGGQGSCTAWAVAYALKSSQESREFGWKPNSTSTQFSPAYIYNQINDGKDEGSSIQAAMDLVKTQGICTLKDMPYNQYDYTTKPNTYQRSKASNFKAKSVGYFTGIEAIKEQLCNGNGVVIPIRSYDELHYLNDKDYIYDDYSRGTGKSSHAICIIGYDYNTVKGGAFKFINSWGTNWGKNGYGYIPFNKINQVWCETTIRGENGKEEKRGKFAYVMVDNTNQHYKFRVLKIQTLVDIPVYKAPDLKQKISNSTIKKGSKVTITGFVKASNGNPPCFKVKNGYITARNDKVKALGIVNVKYSPNGGSGKMTNDTFVLGLRKNLKANAFKKTGYTFNGWYANYKDKKGNVLWCCKKDGSAKFIWRTRNAIPKGYSLYKFNNKQSVLNFAGCPANVTVNLTAQWKVNSFKIKYYSNGGSGKMKDTYVTYGKTKRLEKNTFTRKGYVFSGWKAVRTKQIKNLSNCQWLYVKKANNKSYFKWFVPGHEAKGYKIMKYADKQVVSTTTDINDDVIYMVAQWTKAKKK